MSKLDRFLVSKGLLASFPFLSDLCLDRNLSDHRPILMEDTWKSLATVKISIQSKLSDIDKILDQGGSNEEILSDRSLLLKALNDINSIDSLEAAQRSKVRWAIEGDKNTKFFHGILNSKRSQLAIRGTLVDGEWIIDPLAILEALKHDIVAAVKEFFASVKDAGLFSGIPIDSSLTISHLFFADDAIFVEEVDVSTITIGCLTFTTPFVHLGVKVGGALSRIKFWDDVLDIIREVTILCTKRINLLDVIRKKVGNGLNTLFWEDPWLDDLALKHKVPRVYALDNYKQITVVEKINHAFIVDTFCRPPRGGAEEEQLGFLLSRMDGIILTYIPGRWVWSLEATGEFSVKFVKKLIDDSILLKKEVATRWVKVMPIKINVFAWRVRFNKLHTRSNLSLKGIDISSIVSPLCHASVELMRNFF
ncbi:hypothetical protein Tco_0295122 [Tanacetum coccineum]